MEEDREPTLRDALKQMIKIAIENGNYTEEKFPDDMTPKLVHLSVDSLTQLGLMEIKE